MIASQEFAKKWLNPLEAADSSKRNRVKLKRNCTSCGRRFLVTSKKDHICINCRLSPR